MQGPNGSGVRMVMLDGERSVLGPSAARGAAGAAAAFEREAMGCPRVHAASDPADVREAGRVEESSSDAGAIAAAADHRDRAVARQLGQAAGEVAGANVPRAGDMASLVFACLADIQHERRIGVSTLDYLGQFADAQTAVGFGRQTGPDPGAE